LFIEANVKETLKSTIDELFTNYPKNASKDSIQKSHKRHYEKKQGIS
jgi:hypothetical protein